MSIETLKWPEFVDVVGLQIDAARGIGGKEGTKLLRTLFQELGRLWTDGENPAKAGGQDPKLDSGFRRNDDRSQKRSRKPRIEVTPALQDRIAGLTAKGLTGYRIFQHLFQESGDQAPSKVTVERIIRQLRESKRADPAKRPPRQTKLTPQHKAIVTDLLLQGKRPGEIKQALEKQFGKPLPFGIGSIYSCTQKIRRKIREAEADPAASQVLHASLRGRLQRTRHTISIPPAPEETPANDRQDAGPTEESTQNPPVPPVDVPVVVDGIGVSEDPDHIPIPTEMIEEPVGPVSCSDPIYYGRDVMCKRRPANHTTFRDCLIHQYRWRSGQESGTGEAYMRGQLSHCLACPEWILEMAELKDLAEEAEADA